MEKESEKRRPGRPRKPEVVEDRRCVVCDSVFQVGARYAYQLSKAAKTCSRVCQLTLAAQTMMESAKAEGVGK